MRLPLVRSDVVCLDYLQTRPLGRGTGELRSTH